MASYVSNAEKEAIFALVDYNIIYGSGSLLNGIASAACTGFTSISSPITAAEVKNIFDLYYGGKNGKWYLSKSIFNEIGDLYETAAAGSLPLFATNDGWLLWGLPVVISDVMVSRSILLADLTQYAIIQKDIREDINTSLKWLEDESCLRSVYRVNGDATWATPITEADGSVVHPFVMASGEENSSSSSSSNSSSSNSSESSSSSYVRDWTSSSQSSASTQSQSSGSSGSSVSSLSSEGHSISSESSKSESSESESSDSESISSGSSDSSSMDYSNSSESTSSSESSPEDD
jgi:hypothetical protein